jgi:serine/threonine protein kinase
MNMRLTDLGIAYVSKIQAPLDANGLYAYLPCGTPLYMAPEMERLARVDYEEQRGWRLADPDETEGRHVFYGPKVDWYSFGLVLYEMAATFFQDRSARRAKVSS